MIKQDLRLMAFDCDGVILNSNHIKTDAFRLVASRFGQSAADNLVRFHIHNGGLSRYIKFRYFLDQIVGITYSEADIHDLCSQFSDLVYEGLLGCEISPFIYDLRRISNNARWMVVSGGDQSELRKLFRERNLDDLFDAGIYGSPDSKENILSRYFEVDCLNQDSLFLGDSRYDHMVAKRFNMSFIFVSDWSEMPNWNEYCNENELISVPKIYDIVKYINA